MASPLPTVALFARYPQAGKAKTRLIPELGAEGAAHLHRRLVEQTLATIRASGLPFAVHFTGAAQSAFVAWLGSDVRLVPQGEGDLGARLARVAPPAILLGADVPDLTAQHLEEAARALVEHEVVIGPASDGGYYLLGFARRLPFLFAEMDWGTSAVRRETLRRLAARRIDWLALDELPDCDRPEDLTLWPGLAS